MLRIKLAFGVCILSIFLIIFSGCIDSQRTGNQNTTELTIENISFRDIPGVTENEIWAVEELQRQRNSFVYGAILSTEAFEEYGEVHGFAALFCNWLTNLFDIRFDPVLYGWNELIAGLENTEIDFTGELTATDLRRQMYYMTGPIARRSIQYITMADSIPLQNIVASRTPRYAFLESSIIKDYVDTFVNYDFSSVFIDSYETAYSMLVNGQVDAFFDDSSMEAVFDVYDNVVSNNFIPVIGMPVSLSTKNPLLEPVISIVQKALEYNAGYHLIELYSQGEQEHRKHRLYIRLTEEERDFLRSSGVIPFAAEFSNYPISFFNDHEKQWQGIYFDMLDEVSAITGLQFELINDENTPFSKLVEMLEAGDVYLVSELLHSEIRVGRFRWSTVPSMIDNYAFLSKTDTPNVSINDVFNVRVGVPLSTAYADMFHAWFPLHTNSVEYDSSDTAFLGLERGEVDVVISSQRNLLSLTNYHELSGYKANLIFSHAAESSIGFNIDQVILSSIIDKALNLIDVKGISAQWSSKTFDYQARLLEAQRPWLIGAVILVLMILSLVSILFARSRNARKQLDSLVKKRTAELEIATEAAKAASRSKSSFLANMSHEIRTPMNTILGVTEIMMQSESLTDENEEGLNKLYSSCDMLMGIINDILDFSKIEAGKLDIKPAQYYVASLINDSVHLNMMRIGEKPIEFKIIVNEDIPAKLIGDELRIKQILNNLLSNAFKYTEAGTVMLSVFSQPVDDDFMIIISVQDTGQGMTPEQVDKLFDEYSRFNDEFNRTIEGTGLGLSITQRLISLMNGKIRVESQPGVGSLFVVSLQQGRVDSEVLGKELAERLQQFRLNDIKYSKRTRIARDPMPYGKVLVVDDVEANLYVAEGLMKPYRLHIDSAMSGYDAIDKIKSGSEYDIIFMDHMMPGMDGMETVKHIRELGYKAPIVALTANAVAGQADIFLQNGFNDFISKPIDIRQLNSVLNKLIRDKQPPEVIQAAKTQMNNTPDQAAIKIDEIDGMDTAKGLKKFNDDIEIYIKVLRSYTTSIRPMFDIIENVNEGNLIEFQRAVHSIKGTSLDIYAVSIGQKAKELEEAAKAGNLTFIKEESPAFLENVKKIIYDIENMLSVVSPKYTKTKKDKIEEELLVELLGFCEEYDMDGVDSVMAEIELYQYESDAGLAAWLRENVDVVDFEAIAEKLAGNKK